MSYASVASHNIPFGEMPKPDQNLADGHFAGEHTAEGNVDGKINILPAGSDPEHPDVHPAPVELAEPIAINPPPTYEPSTSDAAPTPAPAPHKADVHLPESGAQFEADAKKAKKDVEKGAKDLKKDVEKESKDLKQDAEKKAKELKKKAKAELNEAENKLGPYWEKTKDVVLRPGTLGGLVGVLNVGILSTLGYFAYTRRDQPWDRRIVGGAAAGTLALFGAEGYLAESYLSTPEGRQEAERAKREGSKAYLQAKEIILRPGVAGGLAGFFNLAVIGTVGFFSYKHWNQPWDRRTVSAVTIGLLGLSGLEGYAGKVYADKELPKH